MHKSLRLGLVGLNQTPMDWNGNLARIRQALAASQEAGAQIVCFPELSVSGYGCEDNFLHPDTAARSPTLTQELAKEIDNQVVLVGLPYIFEGETYNAVAVLNRGAVRGLIVKTHLAREGIHYEPRWFRPWPAGRRETVMLDGAVIPLGAYIFSANQLNFAVEICEDAWVAPEQRPCRFVREAQWIFNASASHFSLGKADIRERLVVESSRVFKVGYAYANLVGCESGRAIYDGELLFAENGEMASRGGRLYLDDFQLLCHDIQYEPGANVASVKLDITDIEQETALKPIRHRNKPEPEQEFAAAASLALFDYMRKSRARGFTLSLSGGVDSSAVAG